MGLPGSGKTTLAKELSYHFLIPHYNADTLREFHDDWDFSNLGRARQAHRMSSFEFGILDFVCPSPAYRDIVNADYTIWMDTIEKGRFEDTNKVFIPPTKYNVRIEKWIGLNRLRKCLGDSSPGIQGIQNFLEEQLPKLAK